MTATAAPARPARATTPRSVKRLRRLQLTAVALLLTFGALAVTALAVSYNSALAARATLAQYTRLVDAQTSALAVQQAATTWAVKPSSSVRTDLDTGLGQLAATLADAAGVPEDRAAIAPLTGALVSYGMTVQDALNADGTASAAIAARANTQLTSDLVEPLGTVAAAAAARTSSDLAGNWLPWVIGGAALAGAALVAVLVALARSSRRYLNLGVAGGLVCALISLALVLAATGSAANTAAGFDTSTRPTLDRLAEAREQLNRARADELLAVGQRTAGTAAAQRWKTEHAAAAAALAQVPRSTAAVSAVKSYGTAHTAVTDATTAARWDAAAGLVTGTGSAAKAFTDADTAVAALATSVREPLTSAVRSAGDQIVLAIAGVLLLTLLSAALATWGVARRIQEYR